MKIVRTGEEGERAKSEWGGVKLVMTGGDGEGVENEWGGHVGRMLGVSAVCWV